MAAVAGGAGSARGRLGAGTGVWLGEAVGAAGPIADTVVEKAESERCEQLLRILLRSADPQDSMGKV